MGRGKKQLVGCGLESEGVVDGVGVLLCWGVGVGEGVGGGGGGRGRGNLRRNAKGASGGAEHNASIPVMSGIAESLSRSVCVGPDTQDHHFAGRGHLHPGHRGAGTLSDSRC